MSVIITHPTGNEFFRAAVQGLNNAGLLQRAYTSIASFPGTVSYSIGGIKMFNDIRRRGMKKSLENKVQQYPLKEAGRLIATKLKMHSLVKHEKGFFSVDNVYSSLDQYVAKQLIKEKLKGATCVYAYEDGAVASFKSAKELGIKCFYDLPIGYWKAMRQVMTVEEELHPEWASTLEGLKDSVKKLNKKDIEIALSDVIIAASSFTAKTLKDYNGLLPEIHVIPYGFPITDEKKYNLHTKRRLKILFVGGLSQRKGLSYLFDAVKDFEPFLTLTIVGRAPNYNCKILMENLKQHTWIETIAHNNLLALMQEHDILVFPSLFEGFGQVITEAMSRGTPVITTERTAGADIIKHGVNGWLAKAGSVTELKEILHQLLLHPNQIKQAGIEALETARQRPWAVYEQELVNVIISRS